MQRVRKLAFMLGLFAILAGSALPMCYARDSQVGRTTFDAFKLPLVDGSQFINSAQFSGRITIVNYWRSDCPACLSESTMLNHMAQAWPKVAFIGVAIDDRVSAMRFITRKPSSYPQAYAPLAQEQLLHRSGNHSGGLPYTLVLDPQHRICATHSGLIDQQWLELAVQHCNLNTPNSR